MAVLTGKFFTFDNTTGKYVLADAKAVSTGAPDAGIVVKTNENGEIDLSMMPTGIGQELEMKEATENIAAGAFVQRYAVGGVVKVRNADKTGKPADGFVLASVTTGNQAAVYDLGQRNTAVTVTADETYFLGSVGGVVVAASISWTVGDIVQCLGKATAANVIPTRAYPAVEVK